MNDDRRLLELAAKAAGDEVEGWTADADFVPVTILRSGARWQPLLRNRITDCMGDALRLAVKLEIDIFRNSCSVGVTYRIPVHGTPGEYDTVIEPVEVDPYAATRRAIVRAAASIGEKPQ